MPPNPHDGHDEEQAKQGVDKIQEAATEHARDSQNHLDVWVPVDCLAESGSCAEVLENKADDPDDVSAVTAQDWTPIEPSTRSSPCFIQSTANTMKLDPGTRSFLRYMEVLDTDDKCCANKSAVISAFIKLVNAERDVLGVFPLPSMCTASMLLESDVL